MSSSSSNIVRNPAFKSIFVRSTGFMALCILLVVTTTEYLSHLKVQKVIVENVAARASEANAMIAGQIGAAVKFGNAPAVQDVIMGVVAGSRGDAQGGLALLANGNVIYDSAVENGGDPVLNALAEKAIETGEEVVIEQGLARATPIRFGPDNGVVGAVATHWTDTRQLAALQATNRRSLMIAGLVFLGALAMMAGFLAKCVTRPLLRTARSMQKVEAGDYAAEISGTERGDEIGVIAQRLQCFRDSLSEAEEQARDSAFKSAGFAGSSAAMMLLDAECRVTYYNPACQDLFVGLQDSIAKHWAGFDATDLLGVRIDQFKDLENVISVLDAQEPGERLKQPMRVARRRIEISFHSVSDESGARIGYVAEWADVTEVALNAAVLSSIEDNQLRVDIGHDSKAFYINEKFSDLTGFSLEELSELHSTDLFKPDGMTKDQSMEISRRIGMGGAHHGRYWVKSKEGRGLFVEGSFTAIMDDRGRSDRAIFLGMDVTEALEERKAAQARQEAVQQEQQQVVEALSAGLRGLATGNLTVRIDAPFVGDYEAVKRDFNSALETLSDAMGAVLENAESIRSETSEITNAADDLSHRTEKQAATLEETAAAVDQLTTSVQSAADGADEATKIAQHAQANAETGGEVAEQAKTAMDRIKISSQEIAKITSVIDDIAFQTNLLALNAGVEAARAGEAGRGFAVVATEVRALAQRSSDAASEINGLIKTSGDEVKNGVELVDKTSEALSQIVQSVRDISTRVSEIASSSREQSAGLIEINLAMNDLDQVTQQNAAMFEETTAASHALTAEANALGEAASRFRIGDGGDGIGRAPQVRAQRLAASRAPEPKSVAAAVTTLQSAVVQDIPESEQQWDEF